MLTQPKIDILKIFANDKRLILYRPEWRAFTGSVLSTILLQQILYWWDKMGRRPFYKFKEPCGNKLYIEGDSWIEELGFSRTEFDTALKKIAVKISAKNPPNPQSTHFVEYWTDINRVTYYTINVDILEKALTDIYINQDSCFMKRSNPDLEERPPYLDLYPIKSGVNTASGGGENPPTETTYTEKTTTTTAHAAHTHIPKTTSQSLSSSFNDVKEQNNIIPLESSQAITNTSNTRLINKVDDNCNLNDIQTELIALVPEKHQQPIVIKFINQTLKSGVNSDTFKSAILYTNTHSKGNIKQYRSYLGKTLENPNWHVGYLEQTELEHKLQQEIKNTAVLKTNAQEPKIIDKGKEDTEAFDKFMKTVDVEAFDKFIETECWDSVNNVMRRLWKGGTRYSTRRINMKNFINAQNGTDIIDNSILPIPAQSSQSSVPLPAIAKPFESPPLQVQRPKGSLTSISFIMPELMQGIIPQQPTA